ncbi:hypothetical protein EON65_49435 [archaeon]|nr:MAG: hypothetical protein EON65_49435 [archaeon]
MTLANLHRIDQCLVYGNIRIDGGLSVVELLLLEKNETSECLVQTFEHNQFIDAFLWSERTHHFLVLTKSEIIVYEREFMLELQWRELLRIPLLRDLHYQQGSFVFPLFFVVTPEEATIMNILTSASHLFTANELSVCAYRNAVMSYTGTYLAVPPPPPLP